MNVASLQTLLRNQAAFAEEAGAGKSLTADLATLAERLGAFRDMKLGELCDLLQQAHEYRTTGVLPVKAGRATARAPKPSAEQTIREAAQRLNGLYERALDVDFHYDDLDAELRGLGKLTVAQLKSVADEFGVILSGKPKKNEVIQALGRKVQERRAFHSRARINPDETLTPPAAAAGEAAAVQGF